MKCRYREKRISSGMREEIFIYPEFAKAKKENALLNIKPLPRPSSGLIIKMQSVSLQGL